MTFRSSYRRLLGPALLACGLVLLALAPAAGDDKDPPQVKHLVLALDPFSEANGAREVTRGTVLKVAINGHTTDGWYTYPITSASTGKPGKITVEGDAFQLLAPIEETAPQTKTDDLGVALVHKKPFTWTLDVYVKPSAKPGPTKLTLKVEAQVCKGTCIDEKHTLEVPLTISDATPVPPTPELTERIGKQPEPPAVASADGGPKKSSGLLASIGTAVVGGIVSLLTPCVFPMIPITVSYFLKQAERRKPSPGATDEGPAPQSPLLMAAIYSGTIVLVLTAGGLALQEVLVKISTHPVTNLVLGALFLFFAFSLLGWYDITLPSWLQDVTSSREGRGGLIGVFFMALTFSIVSFACVGPIYGSFISLQATSGGALGFLERALPVLAYSVAFASPFFVLALFPTLMRTMPRAGSWMNAVKVVMGFLELAAVVKFFRGAELLWRGRADILSYDLSMGLYVAICIACGLYLFGLYRLPHDHEAPESIGVPRMAIGLAFVALGLYLTPALFKVGGAAAAPQPGQPAETRAPESQRPGGTVFAWIDSFLLPDPESGGWETDLEKALAKARREKKLIFVDFTGIYCTNCKLNERRIFSRPDVQQAFSKHVLLKLHTDTVPAGVVQKPNAEGATALRNDKFKSGALPLYALLRPGEGDSFEILGRFGDDENGLIEVGDVPRFLQFLDRRP